MKVRVRKGNTEKFPDIEVCCWPFAGAFAFADINYYPVKGFSIEFCPWCGTKVNPESDASETETPETS